MKLSTVAQKVLRKRYFLKGEDGEPVETFNQLTVRVANAIAAAERGFPNANDENTRQERSIRCDAWATKFHDIMSNLDFLPNSPTLMNAGLPDAQLSACFLIPVEDNISSIFDAVKNMALIFKSGGGVGLPMSRLRPKDAKVASTGGVSSGPVSFMEVYNTTAEVVAQGGKRRGALMGTLRVDHPDIMEFIKAKQDLTRLTSFNVSVAITEKFMEALCSGGVYCIVDPQTKETCGHLKARDVWNKIVKCAHATGEPGLIFLDRINEYHRQNVTEDGEIEGTNPCGELPLLEYESCNLGSINLANFVEHPFTDNATVDLNRLAAVTKIATRFLDNVIEVNTYPLPQIRKATLRTRKIGLGVMGFADMLMKLGIRYGTENSSNVLYGVLEIIHDAANDASIELGKERGVYPGAPEGVARRNGTLTAIAPTGSISMIADVVGGIEPMFAIATRRESVLDGDPFIQVNQTFVDMLKHHGCNEATIDYAVGELASGKPLSEAIARTLPQQTLESIICAHEVPPSEHVAMQAAAQVWSDSAVSKTANLPHTATEKNVGEIFMQAYSSGCKGITVYRDGCREHQPMGVAKIVEREPDGSETGVGSIPDVARQDGVDEVINAVKSLLGPKFTGSWQKAFDEARKGNATCDELMRMCGVADPVELMSNLGIKEDHNKGHIQPKNRPALLQGTTTKLETGCGSLFVTVNKGEGGDLIELFAHHGKAGVCSAAQCEAIGRLSSMAFRAGVDPEAVADQLRGITCHETAGIGPNKVNSCADGIAKAILRAIGHEPTKSDGSKPVYMGACSDCGAGLVREAGCVVCHACGWKKC